MYFFFMDLENIVGFTVSSAYDRKRFRTLYYSRTFEGEGHGTVIFMEKGAAYFDFDRGTLKVPPGHMLCYDSRTLKRSRGDAETPPSYYIIEFDLVDRLGGIVSAADAGIPFFFRPARPGRVVAIMKEIIATWKARKKHFMLNCSRLGLSLLEGLAASAPEIKTTFIFRGREIEDERIGPVLDHIRRYYKETPDLRTLARKTGLHPATFARLFRKITGLSPRQYILRRKIENAKNSFLNDNLPFAVTAEDLGFCDYSNFCRTFKRFEGMTPSQYCRQYRGG